MSERDCGKWYCQKAKFRYLKFDTDVRIFPFPRADDDDRQGLDREREKVRQWMEAQRFTGGYDKWLAGPGHGSGAAQHYWVWDPDSREKYMEFRGPYHPGDLPADFGALHRGMGWQLPLLAVFYSHPSADDLYTLKKNKVAYTIMLEEEEEDEPEVIPPVVVDDTKEELLAEFDHEYTNAQTNTQRLGTLYEMLYRLLEVVLP